MRITWMMWCCQLHPSNCSLCAKSARCECFWLASSQNKKSNQLVSPCKHVMCWRLPMLEHHILQEALINTLQMLPSLFAKRAKVLDFLLATMSFLCLQLHCADDVCMYSAYCDRRILYSVVGTPTPTQSACAFGSGVAAVIKLLEKRGGKVPNSILPQLCCGAVYAPSFGMQVVGFLSQRPNAGAGSLANRDDRAAHGQVPCAYRLLAASNSKFVTLCLHGCCYVTGEGDRTTSPSKRVVDKSCA